MLRMDKLPYREVIVGGFTETGFTYRWTKINMTHMNDIVIEVVCRKIMLVS